MKLSIIAKKEDGHHAKKLLLASKKHDFSARVHNIELNAAENNKLSKSIGLIWRSSSLDANSERTSLMGHIASKTVVNEGIFRFPMIRYKYFQQEYVKSTAVLARWAIPTYRAKNIKELKSIIKRGSLKLPIIAKPNAGSRGEGIVIIENETSLGELTNMRKLIFQHYIPNNCDWRVIVVGGTPLGAIKRVAAAGCRINNISRGAKAYNETDETIRKALFNISTKVASAFALTYCGVDIIKDTKTESYYFMEVNTAPQWLTSEGFEAKTGVDVGDTIMQWFDEKTLHTDKALVQQVEMYYKNRIDFSFVEAFHFYSRLWLWTGDASSRKKLDDYEKRYAGITQQEMTKSISEIMERSNKTSIIVNKNKSYRKDSFDKFKQLPVYNALLFRVIFCDTIYGKDIRSIVGQHVSDREFKHMFHRLTADENAVRLLSTHAVNFFYLLKNYFKDDKKTKSQLLFDPHQLIDLLDGYKELVNAGLIDNQTSLKLQVYLLTHAILGESGFYNKPVRALQYQKLIVKLERIIDAHYFDISLDNKFEFLVCAEICGHDSKLKNIISSEAAHSTSWAGNFLVDNDRNRLAANVRHCVRTSEHRNVLYLMSQQKFRKNLTKRKKNKNQYIIKKKLIGRLAKVSLPSYGISSIVARVDSGATRSSIAASNFAETTSGLSFSFMYPGHSMYSGERILAKDYELINVKTTTNPSDARYAVRLSIVVDGQEEAAMFTLSDRSHMLYPVLLGRNFLTGRYRIDTDRQFSRSTIKIK